MRACVCMCVCVCVTSFSLISVFVCMLYFRLCMALVCVLERPSVLCLRLCIFHYGVCAVDFVVEPAFDVSVLCLCIVTVLYFPCHCCPVLCLCFVWFDLFKQSGIGLPKVLLHLCNTIDDLEFISIQWRRDYLSAIRLLGNLFQTTLTYDDFPSILAPPCSRVKFLKLLFRSPYCSHTFWSIFY